MTHRTHTASTRTQAAVVRALVDQFEQASSNRDVEPWLRAQLVEELARLGCCVMDLAAVLTDARAREVLFENACPCNEAGAS